MSWRRCRVGGWTGVTATAGALRFTRWAGLSDRKGQGGTGNWGCWTPCACADAMHIVVPGPTFGVACF